MNFYDKIRFKYLFQRKRFQEAIAFYGSENSPMPSDALWAFYKAGCYRTVVEAGRAPTSGRDAVALGVSLAACGDIAAGSRILREAHSKRLLTPTLLSPAARAVAQYSPDTALELLTGQDQLSTLGLRAAQHLALGLTDQAGEIIRKALDGSRESIDPDILLLRANMSADHAAKLQDLNSYLAMYGLSPLRRKDDSICLSASNLVSTAEAGSVRGPLVTVTMPAYNTSGRIGAAIDSLLAQTYRDIEILVVDDNSTDDTVSVVTDFTLRDPRVRLIKRTQNGGPYAARNMALANAHGDFVTCHDSDDWAHPEKIHRQVEPMLKDRDLNVTASKWVRVQDDGLFYATQVHPLTRFNPASPLFRKAPTLSRAGFYENVRTGADSEYIARLRLLYGQRGYRLLSMPLAFGAHRAGSLMTDVMTGTKRGEAMNAERLDYWETWRKKQARALRYRQSLYVGLTTD